MLEVSKRIIVGGSGADTDSVFVTGGNSTSTGNNNTVVGKNAFTANTSGYEDIAIGYNSLAANTSGYYNTAIGARALSANTTGMRNTGVGAWALMSNTTGTENVALGYTLSYNTTGSSNSALGHYAMESNTTGNRNVGIGTYALNTNVTKRESTAIGYEAMRYADSAAGSTVTFNTALGAYALRGSTTAANNTGTSNTALGHSALVNITSGSNNIALGYNTGNTTTTGGNNILIGSGVVAPAATTNNYLNIGNTLYGDLSTGNVGIGTTSPTEKLQVAGNINLWDGNLNSEQGLRFKDRGDAGVFYEWNTGHISLESTENVYINIDSNNNNTDRIFAVAKDGGRSVGTELFRIQENGNVGIGLTNPGYKLDVNGDVNIAAANALRFGGTSVCTSAGCTAVSDVRLKENIQPLENSLEKILQLQGVEYDYRDKAKFGDKHQIGVIAQDTERIYPEVVVTDKKTGFKAVAYDHLVAPLIEAVKTLYNRIVSVETHQDHQDREIASKADQEALNALNKKLEAENKAKDQKIKDLEQRLEKIEKALNSK